MSATGNKISPFSTGAIGAGGVGGAATTTRFWWVRHAPVDHDGRIYGQKDMPCDCTDTAVFSGLARQLPREAAWVTSHLRRTHETARAIVHAGLPGPDPIPGRVSNTRSCTSRAAAPSTASGTPRRMSGRPAARALST
jgi:hypothetical protein